MLFASEPTLGSVSAKAPIFSPVAIKGSHFSCWCFEATRNKVSPTNEVCTVNKERVEQHTLPISSVNIP